MRILTADIGTGTQDIYLFDSRLEVENGYKLVLPSPTLMVRRALSRAAAEKRDIVLTGHLMGGGPSGWGVADALQAGRRVYATPQAAATLDDNLDVVKESGVILISEEEASRLSDEVVHIEMRDFDFKAIRSAFAPFGVSLDSLDGLALAVFDHGNAPVNISDRKFRFDYLAERIQTVNRLSAFAYPAGEIPDRMTRLRSAADCARDVDAPVIVMDTAPAAVLGATQDPQSNVQKHRIVVNIGNMHILGFRLNGTGIEGVFEHHSHCFDQSKLETLLHSFAAGDLTNEQVFADHGHGAWIGNHTSLPLKEEHRLVLIGPRRNLLAQSSLHPYFAAPYGDMMIAGCFGLLRACADHLPHAADEILAALKGTNHPRAPWEFAE
ncbi:MAG: DUF1786 family protein [Anaerolineaceae bacterium]|nr:DUF1786 family protein [Anaerolineaceae bacterium]